MVWRTDIHRALFLDQVDPALRRNLLPTSISQCRFPPSAGSVCAVIMSFSNEQRNGKRRGEFSKNIKLQIPHFKCQLSSSAAIYQNKQSGPVENLPPKYCFTNHWRNKSQQNVRANRREAYTNVTWCGLCIPLAWPRPTANSFPPRPTPFLTLVVCVAANGKSQTSFDTCLCCWLAEARGGRRTRPIASTPFKM